MNLLSILGEKIKQLHASCLGICTFYISVHLFVVNTCTYVHTHTHCSSVPLMQPDFSCVQGAFGSVQAGEGDSKEVGVCGPLHHRAAV